MKIITLEYLKEKAIGNVGKPNEINE